MLGKKKQYIIGLTNLEKASQEDVGQTALFLQQLHANGVNILTGFVITSITFDDFLIANDLVEYIGPRINELNLEDPKNVTHVSEEIRHAINSGVVPDLIKLPIMQAYEGLSGFSRSYVLVHKSPIDHSLDEANYSQRIFYADVVGEEPLLKAIKAAWADLFTAEALTYRAKQGYEGYLTESLIIQKMVQAEVTGKVYTLNPIDNDKNIIEVQAIWGLDDGKIWQEVVADSYYYNKKQDEIVEKKIVAQDFMKVRKGRSDGKDPNMKVNISKAWQKKQKLDDKHVLSIARIAKKLDTLLKKPLEISWVYEAGKTYITDVDDVINYRLTDSPDVSLQSEANKLVKEIETSERLAIGSPTPKLNADADIELIPAKKTMEEYVEEVKTASNQPEKLDTSEMGSSSADQVVVEIKPLLELQDILKGKGFGHGSNFGLAHFVFAESDFANLTGDEVLVIEQLDKKHIRQYNAAKGLIVKGPLLKDLGLYQQIKVPVIADVSEAFDVLRENEVITLVPASGFVYIGAGRDEHDGKKHEAESVILKEEPAKQTVETFNPETKLIQKTEIVAEPVNEVEEEVEPINGEFVKYLIREEIKTSSDFWQLIDRNNNQLDVVNTNGTIINTIDLAHLVGMSMEEAVASSGKNETFFKLATEVLKEILLKQQPKPLILQGIPGHTEMELKLVDYLRNHEALRNFWYALAAVNGEDEQSEYKKIISAQGFRRSSTFKVFTSVALPYAAISLKSLIENNIDGVIIDLDLLAQNFGLKGNVIDNSLLNFLGWMVETVNTSKSEVHLLNRNLDINEDQLRFLLEKGLNNFILPTSHLHEYKTRVASLEVAKVEKKRKRGRKRKEIDFGF